MALLGDVDEVEVRGEGPHHQTRLVEGERIRSREQRRPIGPEVPRPRVVRPQRLGARPVFLDEREAGFALALLQHVAEQAPEGVDVAAQRIVVGLFGRRGCSFRTFYARAAC